MSHNVYKKTLWRRNDQMHIAKSSITEMFFKTNLNVISTFLEKWAYRSIKNPIKTVAAKKFLTNLSIDGAKKVTGFEAEKQ